MKIENMKVVDFGSIKAFFDVNFEKLVVKGWKLVQQEGQKSWVTPPDEKYIDKKTNKTAYKKICEVKDIPLMGKIASTAIEEYQKLTGTAASTKSIDDQDIHS